MNAIKNAFFITIITMTSASALAQPLLINNNYVIREKIESISVAPTMTSDEAYQLALSELNSFKSMSTNELNKELNIQTFTNTESESTHLNDGGFVTVQERMNENGQLEYLGKVNVKVHYAERDNNR